jgi:hypothetical protein
MTNELFFDEVLHGLVALPFAVYLWKKTKSAKLITILFAVTYLIDLDHLVDYFLYYGFEMKLENFFNASYFEATRLAIVPLHAWEYLLPLTYLARKKGIKSYYGPILLGAIPHLIMDTITVKNLAFYSIIYRLALGFRFPW